MRPRSGKPQTEARGSVRATASAMPSVSRSVNTSAKLAPGHPSERDAQFLGIKAARLTCGLVQGQRMEWRLAGLGDPGDGYRSSRRREPTLRVHLRLRHDRQDAARIASRTSMSARSDHTTD
jgi:hypothetical protein